MGPQSKAAVIEVLGGLLEESRANRATLARIEAKLEKRDEDVAADLKQVNGRVSQIERTLGAHGFQIHSPAE